MATSRLIAGLALTFGLIGASAAPLDGVWRSEGWASLYEVRGRLLRSFEVTHNTCVAGFSAERIASQTVEDGATFRLRHGELLYLMPGEDEDHKRLQHLAGLVRFLDWGL